MEYNEHKRIYLAEDDADDCTFFQDALEETQIDCQLATASDGKELMTLLDHSVPPAPDVIFLDLNMPRKNGFECLEEIRSTPRFKDIPVVVLTTTCEASTINEAYALGANKYICKPGNFHSLKKLITNILAMEGRVLSAIPARENFVLAV